MAGIVFAPLTTSPHTDGELTPQLPGFKARFAEVAQPLAIDLPVLTVSLDSTRALSGALSATLPAFELRADNYIPGIISTESGSILAKLPSARTAFDNTALEAPNLAELSVALPLLQFAGTSFTKRFAVLGIDLPALRLRSYDTAGSRLDADLPSLRAATYQTVTAPSAAIFALVDPIGSVLADNTWVFRSKLAFSDSLMADLLFAMRSNIAFTDRADALGKLLLALESHLVVRDVFRFLIEVDIDDSIAFSDYPELRAEIVMRLASQLLLSDDQIQWMSAVGVITSALVVRDALRASLGQTMASALDITDALTAHLSAIAKLVSEVLISDELLGTLHAFTTVHSDVAFTDDFGALLTMLMELDDEVLVYTRFVTPDGDTFIGYVVNVRNSAVSTLTNYPFNAFATVKVGRKTIGLATGQHGVYRLGGDTDDGEPIRARARLGLNDFGTAQLKRMPNAFIGYTSDGKLLLKTITTDKGRKKENWYSLKARMADSPVDGRFDIAKGLTARYWSWEIENVNGADFAIDDLKVWPMTLQRRKSGR